MYLKQNKTNYIWLPVRFQVKYRKAKVKLLLLNYSVCILSLHWGVGVREELPVTNKQTKQTLELTAYQKSLIASFCPCHILPTVF